MNKKKNINKWGVILGLFLMYIGTYIFLVNTTNNNSVKDYTYINKVFAKLQFFQNQTQTTPYNQTNNVLSNGKWASPNFPLQAIYGTGVIINTNNPAPISNGIGTLTNNQTIVIRPPRRHSH